MEATIGVTGCSTISGELQRCCRQLGLPIRLYAGRPACLSEAARADIQRLVDEAATAHEDLIIALGSCCGEVRAEGAAAVSASRCTEMLLGSMAYGWLADRGVLSLPPRYFGAWLRDADLRPDIERILSQGAAQGAFRAIAAVDEGDVRIDPAGISEVARLTGQDTRRLFTGLGHLRETLRDTARRGGIRPGRDSLEPIPSATLGPGDNCLVLPNGSAARDETAQAVADQLVQHVRCIWVSGNGSAGDLLQRLAHAIPDVGARSETGEIRIVTPAELLAETDAAEDPARLVAHWVRAAEDALAAGFCGICLVHGVGWAASAGLSSEWLLAYASHLAEACARWPVFSLAEVAPEDASAADLDELARTHSLIWESGSVLVSPNFEPSAEYLGAEDLLTGLLAADLPVECAGIAPLVSALADGELPPGAGERVRSHVEGCPRCRALLAQTRDAKQALSAQRRSVEHVADELWARIAAQLSEEAVQ
jgi:hypothetical protein